MTNRHCERNEETQSRPAAARALFDKTFLSSPRKRGSRGTRRAAPLNSRVRGNDKRSSQLIEDLIANPSSRGPWVASLAMTKGHFPMIED